MVISLKYLCFMYTNISGELMLQFFTCLVISRFDFEGVLKVLIAPVPGHCILNTLVRCDMIRNSVFHLL